MQGERTDLPNTKNERFWDNVDIKDKDDCWNWIHSPNRKGYPSCSSGNTHRIAYILSNGPIPKYDSRGRKLIIRHICNNKRCCNPRHLRIGTASENARDRFRLPGAKKLTNDQVIEIRRLKKLGYSLNRLATQYNTSPGTIKNAVIGLRTYGEIV